MAIDLDDDEAAARALLAAAEADTSPAAQRLRAGGRLMVYLFIVYLTVAPIFFGLSIWRLIQALQSGDWLPFWAAAIGVVALLLPLLFSAFYDPLAERNSAIAYICLNEAIASGDETLAPTLPLSKTADTDSAKTKYARVIGELSSARMAYALVVQFANIGLLLFLIVWVSKLWPLQASNLDAQAYFLQTILPFNIAMAFSMALSIATMFFVLSQAIGYSTIANESGLRWRMGFLNKRWRQVSWDSIRASGRFVRLDVTRNKWEHNAYVYLLDIGEALLTWGINPFLSAAGGAHMPKDIQAEWEDFAAFISARSGLPLRDITPVALTIARATGGRVRERKVAEMLLAHPGTADPITIPGLERAVTIVAAEENPQRRRLLRTLLWIPLALFVALYVVGAIIQFRG